MHNGIDNGASTMRPYTAYGDGGTSTARSGIAYTGEVVEPDTGWYLLGERSYAPALRRFLSPDATSPFGGGGWNRYGYCSGDPVNRVDPDGRMWLRWAGMALGLIANSRTVRNTFNAARKHWTASLPGAAGGLGVSTDIATSMSSPSTAYVVFNATLAVVATGLAIGSVVAAMSGNTGLAIGLGLAPVIGGLLGNPPLPKKLRQRLMNRLGIDPVKPEGAPPAEMQHFRELTFSPSPWPDVEGRRPSVAAPAEQDYVRRFGRRDREYARALGADRVPFEAKAVDDTPRGRPGTPPSTQASTYDTWKDEPAAAEHLYRAPDGLLNQAELIRAFARPSFDTRIVFGMMDRSSMASLRISDPLSESYV